MIHQYSFDIHYPIEGTEKSHMPEEKGCWMGLAHPRIQ